jgi:LysR family hca operon transcriptional activator
MSMTDHLKIRDLELVVALHEEGNLTKAAKRVGITEPALSKRLGLIEQIVQAQLFIRKYGGATITAAGRAFVEHIRLSIHSCHRAVHEAREAKRGERHKLRIGTSPYLPSGFITFLHSIELQLYRDLEIEIVAEYSIELLGKLEHQQIDLAFVNAPPKSALVTTLPVAKRPYMIVFREGHPLAAKRSTTLAEVADYPWVFFSRNIHPPLHDLILRCAEAAKKPANVVHLINQADQLPALLKDDKLIAWLHVAGAEQVAHSGLMAIPLHDEQIFLETHLASLVDNKSQLISEYVRAFVPRYKAQQPPEQLSLPIG